MPAIDQIEREERGELNLPTGPLTKYEQGILNSAVSSQEADNEFMRFLQGQMGRPPTQMAIPQEKKPGVLGHFFRLLEGVGSANTATEAVQYRAAFGQRRRERQGLVNAINVRNTALQEGAKERDSRIAGRIAEVTAKGKERAAALQVKILETGMAADAAADTAALRRETAAIKGELDRSKAEDDSRHRWNTEGGGGLLQVQLGKMKGGQILHKEPLPGAVPELREIIDMTPAELEYERDLLYDMILQAPEFMRPQLIQQLEDSYLAAQAIQNKAISMRDEPPPEEEYEPPRQRGLSFLKQKGGQVAGFLGRQGAYELHLITDPDPEKARLTPAGQKIIREIRGGVTSVAAKKGQIDVDYTSQAMKERIVSRLGERAARDIDIVLRAGKEIGRRTKRDLGAITGAVSRGTEAAVSGEEAMGGFAPSSITDAFETAISAATQAIEGLPQMAQDAADVARSPVNILKPSEIDLSLAMDASTGQPYIPDRGTTAVDTTPAEQKRSRLRSALQKYKPEQYQIYEDGSIGPPPEVIEARKNATRESVVEIAASQPAKFLSSRAIGAALMDADMLAAQTRAIQNTLEAGGTIRDTGSISNALAAFNHLIEVLGVKRLSKKIGKRQFEFLKELEKKMGERAGR